MIICDICQIGDHISYNDSSYFCNKCNLLVSHQNNTKIYIMNKTVYQQDEFDRLLKLKTFL